MDKNIGEQPDIVSDPLAVNVVEGEIILDTNTSPSLTAAAARETGQRLIDAAGKLDET